MSYLNTYHSRMTASGLSQAERRQKITQNTISDKFGSTEFYIVDGIEPDGTNVKKRLKVIHEDLVMQVNPSRAQSLKFIAYPGEEIKPGTFFKDILEDDYMVLSSSNMNNIVYRGIMQKVNNIFKWTVNGELFENFAIIASVSMVRDGIDEGRVITLPEDALSVYAPQNEVTDTLNRGVRFIVGNYVYKITKVDRYTNPFMVYIVAYEDVKHSGDNFEQGIADFNMIKPENIPTNDFEKKITGTNSLRIGESGIFTVKFFNNESYNEKVVWDFDNTIFNLVNSSDTELIISVVYDFNLVGTVTQIKASLEEDLSIYTEKEITIKGLV